MTQDPPTSELHPEALPTWSEADERTLTHHDMATGEPGSTRITRGDGLAVQGLGSLVGAHWGDFILGPLLGRGGMGAVYRAHQVSLDRAVAIKVLPPEVAERSEMRERFLREARAIAQVASPHIVQVFHAGTHQGWHFYAMELVDAPDLGRRLRDGWRPDVAKARDMVLQAARGLATAARWGIVHRDIKPGNMLLTQDGCLKLTDFGLVRRDGEHQLTVSGQVMGTAGYLSPEQALGKVCDARSDLYALGVVLYELLAGRLPFIGEAATSVIYQHVHEQPVPVEQHNPSIDAATAAICARLLAKSPEARYQSASELIQDLEQAAAGKPLTHTAVQRRRRRVMPVLITTALAAALAITGWSWHMRRSSDTQAAAQLAAADRVVAELRSRQEREAEAKRHDSFGRFADLVIGQSTFRLRAIPAGTSTIGSPGGESGRGRDETPVTVRFSTTYWLGDSEVTQAQWAAIMGGLPEQAFSGPDLPITEISRAQAEAFCGRLAAQVPGLRLRLPTEPEWEYAARAGQSGPWAGGRPLATQGWYYANAGKQPHPVRQFPPNPWGLFDLHGNAAEWTCDAYAGRSSDPLIDPAPVIGSDKSVLKGGAWDDDPEDCRLACREPARSASKRTGFRILASELPTTLR